jgi:hypothetical protein
MFSMYIVTGLYPERFRFDLWPIPVILVVDKEVL